MRHEPQALLTGKVAVVTGGGGGIGRGISETFAAHGASVVVAEIDEARARETEGAVRDHGGEASAHVVDVRRSDEVDRLRDATLASYGRADVLVNNVGHYVLRGGKEFVDTTEDDWDALYDVNLKHVLLCTRAFLPARSSTAAAAS